MVIFVLEVNNWEMTHSLYMDMYDLDMYIHNNSGK